MLSQNRLTVFFFSSRRRRRARSREGAPPREKIDLKNMHAVSRQLQGGSLLRHRACAERKALHREARSARRRTRAGPRRKKDRGCSDVSAENGAGGARLSSF